MPPQSSSCSLFVNRQVNKVNPRKEFFKVEVKAAVEQQGIQASWTLTAAAKQYRETRAIEQGIASKTFDDRTWRERQLMQEGENVQAEAMARSGGSPRMRAFVGAENPLHQATDSSVVVITRVAAEPLGMTERGPWKATPFPRRSSAARSAPTRQSAPFFTDTASPRRCIAIPLFADTDVFDADAIEAVSFVASQDEMVFTMIDASVAPRFPEQATFLTQGLRPSTGMNSVTVMSMVLDRMDRMERGLGRKDTRKQDQAALELLASRGVPPELREKLAGAVQIATSAARVEQSDDAELAAADEKYVRALGEIRAWYEDFSASATAQIPVPPRAQPPVIRLPRPPTRSARLPTRHRRSPTRTWRSTTRPGRSPTRSRRPPTQFGRHFRLADTTARPVRVPVPEHHRPSRGSAAPQHWGTSSRHPHRHTASSL